ncbi:Uma2 family endonuclease [Altericista sp. CCNU0014]|uniref:Uma2 family endonuclease n=1 Tax=Altericista sp. CCNU0014 TaxID=3082949 RepID=UPI00384ED4F5
MYQADPPRSPQESLPTMYDLPSEEVGDPGLPDEFHVFQPRLLEATCLLPNYPPNEVFTASDPNLYYDGRHPLWYKRPDWFLVLGVSRAQSQQDLRFSYVIWQEVVVPFLVVELLSPTTELDDLGQTLREVNQPSTKWQVYEQLLRIPYYAVFDRYQSRFRMFRLVATCYQEMEISDQKFWFDEIQLGLGVWSGLYQNIEGLWLRWHDALGNWIPLSEERFEQEKQRAEQERQRADREKERADQLAKKLRELGLASDRV